MSHEATESWFSQPSKEPLKLAVLISGGGRTLLNILEQIDAGRLHAQVVTLIASNETSREKIVQKGVTQPVHVMRRRDFETTSSFSNSIFDVCREADVELVCMAGFLSLIEIPTDYQWRVINIHPALLPAFGGQGMYGHHVHEAVLQHGCKVTGCTVHFADNTYDTGPILLQRCCSVEATDDADALAARVFEQECVAYPEAIETLAQGRVRLVNGRTLVS